MSSSENKAAIIIGATFTGQAATDSAKKALSGVHAEAEGLQHQLKEFATEAVKELAAAFAVEKIFEFGKELLETGKQLGELKEKTGIGVEVLDGLSVAAARASVPFDALQAALKKFAVSSTDANNGSVASIAAFKNIGVSVEDLKSKNPSQALQLVIDKFSKLEDGPNKAAAAVKIFGRAGSELIPLLNEGSAAIAEFGIGISDDFAERAKVFDDTLFDLGAQTKKLGVSVLNELLPTLQEITNSFKDASPTSSGTLKFVDYLGEGLRIVAVIGKDAAHDLVVGFDAVETILEASGEALAHFVAGTVDSVSTLAAEAKALVTGNRSEIDGIEAEFQKRKDDRDKLYINDQEKRAQGLVDRTIERNKQLAADEAALHKNSLLFGEGTTAEILARQRAATQPEEVEKRTGKTKSNSEEKKKETDAIEKYRIEQEKLVQSQLDALGAADMTVAEYKKLTEQRKLEAEEQKRGVGFTKEAKASLHEITLELIDQNNALIDLQEAQKASFGQGAKEALHDYAEAAKDIAGQTKNVFTHAFSGMEDALVSFVQTGKLSFSSLAASIEADLIRIAAKQLIVGAIGSIAGAIGGGLSSGLTAPSLGSQFGNAGSGSFGGLGVNTAFANGGIMTEYGPAPLRKYANGGIASSPQVALYGEGSRPEAFVPLPDGRNIPVKLSGSASSGTNVVINVSVAANGESSQTSTQDGKNIGNMIAAQIKTIIINEKRPGGLLA